MFEECGHRLRGKDSFQRGATARFDGPQDVSSGEYRRNGCSKELIYDRAARPLVELAATFTEQGGLRFPGASEQHIVTADASDLRPSVS
jgi:hypothetical protein